MTKPIYLIALAAGACAFCSCNSFIGFGRDIQSLGGGMVNTGHGRSWNSDDEPQAPVVPAQTPPTEDLAPQAPAQ